MVVNSSPLMEKMEDQEQDSVKEEVAPPETDFSDSQENVEETQVQETEVQKDEVDEQERNWRAMRQRQKELEYENKQKTEMLDRFLQMQNQQTQQAQPQIAEDPIDPEDYANYGGVEKLTKKTVQPLEKKIADLEVRLAQEEQAKKLNNLRAQYSDFDDVVNIETLEILEKTEPELAATIAEFKDPVKMGIQSYKYIKALNLVDQLPKARRSKEINQKIEQNKKTVQSPMAYDKRPMAQAYKSTAAEQKSLYAEMMGYASQANGL